MDRITVEKRSITAKAKQLRRAGIVPCVICGGALSQSLLVQMDKIAAHKLFQRSREGSKLQIALDDRLILVQIKEKTRDILTNEITHINFQALSADQKVHSLAHILLQNADKVPGTLDKMLLEIPYIALPEDMVDTVSIDLEGMPTGSAVTVGEIAAFKNEKIELLVEADSLVFRISDKKSFSPQEQA